MHRVADTALLKGERLPTLDGDAVIVHQNSTRSEFDVWLVIADRQPARDASVFRPMRVSDYVAANRLAREFVPQTERVFLVEEHSNTWTIVTTGRRAALRNGCTVSPLMVDTASL